MNFPQHVNTRPPTPEGILRSSEFVGATLGQIETDAQGDHWLKLVGKGSKAGKVALPPLARVALDHYLMQRGVPTTPAMWKPSTPLIADLQAGNNKNGITTTMLWNVTKRFFVTTADVIEAESPKTAEKLRRASPHWMRHYLPNRTMSCNSQSG